VENAGAKFVFKDLSTMGLGEMPKHSLLEFKKLKIKQEEQDEHTRLP
jgi:hypothetical protein